jgi:YbbR domain-containing protein
MQYTPSTGSVHVTLGGPVADLDRIDPTSFTITVDVAGLGPGSHEVEAVPNVQAGLKVIAVDPQSVTVTVTPAASAASGAP